MAASVEPLAVAAVPPALGDLPARAQAALDEAFDRHGREETWGDPARWAEVEGRLSGPAELRAWMLAGGDLAALPDEFRARLASLDAEASGLGAGPVFGPLATARPTPPHLGFERSLLEHEPRPEWLADPAATWRGATLTALGEAIAAATHARQILVAADVDRAEAPPELRAYLPEAGLARALSGSRGFAFERIHMLGPAARRALAGWMAEGVAAAARFFFCATRSLRVEAPDTWFAHQVARWTHALMPLLYSHLGHAPVEAVLGLAPEHPTEAMVALELLVRQARVQRDLGPLSPTFRAQYRGTWRRALEIASSPDPQDAEPGIQLVLKRLAQTPEDLVDEAEWTELFGHVVAALRDAPRRKAHADYLQRWVDQKDDRTRFPDLAAGMAILRR